ncbi:hypothetical protein QQ056_17090 [Oscillatoria laete-virens NRMC-F 0139]|nr:hypothetical protein [Oscillatoria laete-virens]MDL5055249.1 hypothetical protein [Oscillatoria laete-virens NRMC-F 0139]
MILFIEPGSGFPCLSCAIEVCLVIPGPIMIRAMSVKDVPEHYARWWIGSIIQRAVLLHPCPVDASLNRVRGSPASHARPASLSPFIFFPALVCHDDRDDGGNDRVKTHKPIDFIGQ